MTILKDVVRITDVRLMALAFMPNHLHLVVQHGLDPLGKLMQRLLCRIARRTQKRHGIEGHVFERSYRLKALLTPRHLRNAIAYTNLNPFRAGLCERAEEYPWCSAADYLSLESPIGSLAGQLYRPMWLFGGGATSHLADELRAYRDFLDWRCKRDREIARDVADSDSAIDLPIPPHVQLKWASEFLTPVLTEHRPNEVAIEDLRDIARRTLHEQGSRLTIDELRVARRQKDHVALRRTIMLRMSAAGHPGKRIADFFGISESAVSRSLANRWTTKAIE